MDGEEELCSSLIQLFREHSPQLLTDIRAGIESCNVHLIERAAHSLKGSTGIFGFTPAFEAAAQFEVPAKAKDVDGLPDAWEQVAATVCELNNVLNQIAELTSESRGCWRA